MFGSWLWWFGRNLKPLVLLGQQASNYLLVALVYTNDLVFKKKHLYSPFSGGSFGYPFSSVYGLSSKCYFMGFGCSDTAIIGATSGHNFFSPEHVGDDLVLGLIVITH